eukprot:a179403_21.p1 GENE.a179403_21~~a179403_21.p1  ORF type:complete len:208 (+),score=68.19 a179403_21:29-625(+)
MADPTGTPATESIKIILLGDSTVGKSKLVERYLMDDYKPLRDSTYALTLHEREIDVGGRKVTACYWDTAGQERFDSMHPSYYHRAHCCILVFDVTLKASYKHLSKWYTELRQFCSDIPCLLAANKIDLQPDATKKSYSFAPTNNLPFYFVSASDGTNVVRLFQDAERLGAEYRDAPPKDLHRAVLDLLEDDDGFDLDA